MGTSVDLTQLVPKAAVLSEITRNDKTRSLKVTDFGTDRKPVCDFLLLIILNNTKLHLISHRFQVIHRIGQIIAFDRGCLYLTASFARTANRWTLDGKMWPQYRSITLSCGAQRILIYWTVWAWITSAADKRMDGQTEGHNCNSNSVRLTTRAKNRCTLGKSDRSRNVLEFSPIGGCGSLFRKDLWKDILACNGRVIDWWMVRVVMVKEVEVKQIDLYMQRWRSETGSCYRQPYTELKQQIYFSHADNRKIWRCQDLLSIDVETGISANS